MEDGARLIVLDFLLSGLQMALRPATARDAVTLQLPLLSHVRRRVVAVITHKVDAIAQCQLLVTLNISGNRLSRNALDYLALAMRIMSP